MEQVICSLKKYIYLLFILMPMVLFLMHDVLSKNTQERPLAILKHK